MPILSRFRIILTATALVLPLASLAPAAGAWAETVKATAAGQLIEGRIKGDAAVDYVVPGTAGQILSVDLSTTNDGLYFNILPQGSDTALFIGQTAGTVADVPLPATGSYVIRVYLMRSAARRNESASYTLGIGLAGGDLADGLAGGPDWWQVSGVTEGALNIRSGPAARYAVVGKAQTGELLQNRGCRLTGPDRWCSIRTDGSGVQGWVAGRFLLEAAAPAAPTLPEGGPIGNGTGFDATGFLPCVTAADEAARQCPFGVVRDGPGNAGVWIAIGGGVERQVLFEGGIPVSATAPAPMQASKTGDLFSITLGAERFDIPEAVVNGG